MPNPASSPSVQATSDEFPDLFDRIRETLISRSAYPRVVVDGIYRNFRNLSYLSLNDDDAFWTMLYVLSYSNMGGKAAYITPWLIYLMEHLSDFRSVATQTKSGLIRHCIGAKLPPYSLVSPRFLKNGDYFTHVIDLAVYFRDKIHDKYQEFRADGSDDLRSFQRWLEGFGNLQISETTEIIVSALSKPGEHKVAGFGSRAARHLVTDLGLPMLKPDVVVKRILYRLNLIGSENPNDKESDFEAIMIGRSIAVATGMSIREVDILLVKYGQDGADPLFGIPTGICLSKNPSCGICSINKYCFY